MLGDQGRDAVLDAAGREVEVRHHIAGRLRHEHVAAPGRRELIAPVHGQAAHRRGHRQPAVLAQHVVDVAAVDARVDPDRMDAFIQYQPFAGAVPAAPGLVLRVEQGVVGGNQVGEEIARVRVVVEATDVVLSNAPLAAEQGRVDFDGNAIHTAPQSEAAIGLRVVDPVVERPKQSVLRVLEQVWVGIAVVEQPLPAAALGQAAVLHLAAAQPEVRRLADQDAAGDRRDGAWTDQAVQIDPAAVHGAVMVGVLEHNDPPHRLLLALAVDRRHEAAHLDDVEQPSFVPRHGDRVFDQGLGCHQLDPEAGGDAQGRHRLGRRQWRRLWHLELAPHPVHDMALAVAALSRHRALHAERQAGKHDGGAGLA